MKRPLIRLDSTPEEADRMYQTWQKCLSDHGDPLKGKIDETGDSSRSEEARKACAMLQPENYQEKLKREHPAEFKDKQRTQVTCIRAHGLKIATNEDGWGYLDPARDMGSAWDHQCEQKSFGG